MFTNDLEGVSAVDKEGLHVQFFAYPVENPKRSAEEGRPIFEDKTFVRITIPSDRYSVRVAEVKVEHQKRWPELWKAFKDGREGVLLEEGDVPIDQWNGVSRARALEWKAMGVLSAMQLARIADGEIGTYGPHSRAERDRAKAAFVTDRSEADREQAKRMRELEARVNELEAEKRQLLNQPAAEKGRKVA